MISDYNRLAAGGYLVLCGNVLIGISSTAGLSVTISGNIDNIYTQTRWVLIKNASILDENGKCVLERNLFYFNTDFVPDYKTIARLCTNTEHLGTEGCGLLNTWIILIRFVYYGSLKIMLCNSLTMHEIVIFQCRSDYSSWYSNWL